MAYFKAKQMYKERWNLLRRTVSSTLLGLHLNALSLTVAPIAAVAGGCCCFAENVKRSIQFYTPFTALCACNQNGSKVVKLWEINSVWLFLKTTILHS